MKRQREEKSARPAKKEGDRDHDKRRLIKNE